MALHCLFGPVTDDFIANNLMDLRAAGDCLAFGPGAAADVQVRPADTWESVCDRFAAAWRPDFLAAWLPYTSVPPWVWTAPVPVVGLAGDWNLLWHRYRPTLPRCDLVLCDALGVEVINRACLAPARPAVLFGAGRADLDFNGPEGERDIDVLFIGNLHAPAQGERLPWLARVARLADRYHVVVRVGVFDDDYRAMLRRAKVVFNRSIRGEFNLRAAEAVAAGALLFQEASHRELPLLLTPGAEYVEYTAADLEGKLDYYLTHDAERTAIAAAGRAKAPSLSFASLWRAAIRQVETSWPETLARSALRAANPGSVSWTERAWQWMTAPDRFADPALPAALAAADGTLDADGLAAFAAVCSNPAEAAGRFASLLKCNPDDLPAGLARAEALAAAGIKTDSVSAARATLGALNRASGTTAWNDPVYPSGMHRFRAEWERASWAHAGDPVGEVGAKRDLLRWRLHALVAELTGELFHYHEAALARPDLPEAQAALGCALARGGHVPDALPHLRAAVAGQPFDIAAARGLGQALADAGAWTERDCLTADRRLLARAAPHAVPIEPWFAASPQSPTAVFGKEPLGVVWEGDFRGLNSLSVVNRELGAEIAARGQVALSVWPPAAVVPAGFRLAPKPGLLSCLHRKLGQTAVHVRHQWPPRWDRPLEGRWVLVQPWEYGSLPKDWVGPILKGVDEVWVHTRHVRDTYLEAGVPTERIHLIPLGVDSARFRPDASPLDLPGAGTFRFLFVGGTIWRKGIDLLLEAFAREFQTEEPVTLLVKGMGERTFYHGRTADDLIGQYRSRGIRVEVIERDLSDADMPGLYTGCDCLVHPYRAEGFALPVLEAMACGRPVIVTDGGACRDYCDADTSLLVAARKTPIAPLQAATLRTVGEPWVFEPDLDALRSALRTVVADPAATRAKGKAASDRVRRDWTWSHAAAAVENRVRALAAGRPAQRQSLPAIPARRMRVSLCMIVKDEEHNLPDCLRGLAELFDEIVVADTGSTDRTREVATGLGARVVEFPWCDDFAAARNASLTAATGDWVMWLDADDRLDDANRAKLRDLFARLGTETAAYAMKCACVTGAGTSETVVDHMRLFRNDPRLRWTYRVHEQILPAIRAIGGQVRWADVTVRHVGYADPALRRKKLDRDLRLLHLDEAAKPDDPFTLFNLGTVYQEIGNIAEALPLLRRSLQGSHPTDSIVRKLYALIAGGHRRLKQPAEALAACQEGRRHYPNDAELLFLEGLLHREQGDAAAAEAAWLQVFARRDAEHFASVDSALAGPKTRHNLAVLYLDQNRYADAEAQWRAALAADPIYVPARVGLGEVFLKQGRWPDLEGVIGQLDEAAPVEAAVLRGRMLLDRKEYAAARAGLIAIIDRHPAAVPPRVILSYALLKEGIDWPAAERALLEVLALEPDHREAQRNLGILRERRAAAIAE